MAANIGAVGRMHCDERVGLHVQSPMCRQKIITVANNVNSSTGAATESIEIVNPCHDSQGSVITNPGSGKPAGPSLLEEVKDRDPGKCASQTGAGEPATPSGGKTMKTIMMTKIHRDTDLKADDGSEKCPVKAPSGKESADTIDREGVIVGGNVALSKPTRTVRVKHAFKGKEMGVSKVSGLGTVYGSHERAAVRRKALLQPILKPDG